MAFQSGSVLPTGKQLIVLRTIDLRKSQPILGGPSCGKCPAFRGGWMLAVCYWTSDI